MPGRKEKRTRYQSESLKETDYLRDLGVDGKKKLTVLNRR